MSQTSPTVDTAGNSPLPHIISPIIPRPLLPGTTPAAGINQTLRLRPFRKYVMDTMPDRVLTHLVDVAYIYDVRVQDLIGKSRSRTIAHARAEAFWRIYSGNSKLSLERIGVFFDRYHSTVLHGIRAYCHRKGIPAPNGITLMKQHRDTTSVSSI